MRRVGSSGAVAALMACFADRWLRAAGRSRPSPGPLPRPRRRPLPATRRVGRRRRPSRCAEPTIVPPEPVRDDGITSASLDDLNRNSPLKPVFFEFDSSELDQRRADGARRQRRRC